MLCCWREREEEKLVRAALRVREKRLGGSFCLVLERGDIFFLGDF